jgi:phosphoglycolate phosphatase-like HAD superfamily hydrolase
MAGLYAAQGLYDRAADIYGRLAAEAPDREDLAEKHREALVHLEEKGGRQAPASPSTQQAVQLLEAWRDAFRQVRRRQRVPVELLEAWRDAFRRLRPRRRGPVELLEAWRDAFRRLRTAGGGATG